MNKSKQDAEEHNRMMEEYLKNLDQKKKDFDNFMKNMTGDLGVDIYNEYSQQDLSYILKKKLHAECLTEMH